MFFDLFDPWIVFLFLFYIFRLLNTKVLARQNSFDFLLRSIPASCAKLLLALMFPFSTGNKASFQSLL